MSLKTLWSEPVDLMNGGPEFFSSLKSILLTNPDPEMQKESLIALFSFVKLSGNFDLIINALDVLLKY
jgi:hypothetical protein